MWINWQIYKLFLDNYSLKIAKDLIFGLHLLLRSLMKTKRLLRCIAVSSSKSLGIIKSDTSVPFAYDKVLMKDK